MSTTHAEPTPAPAEVKPQKTLTDIIMQRKDAFEKVASRYLPADRLVRLAQLVIARTPAIGKCTPLSVIDSLMTCAALGLEPNVPGGVWLVPYGIRQQVNGEWVTINTCTPIIDYRGMIDVARRSGEIAGIHAGLRYEHDKWSYEIDTSAPTMVRLHHVPAEGDRGAVIGAYFLARLKTGETHATVLSKAEIEAYRQRSKNADNKNSPWVKDWNAMAVKTAVRRGVNLLPRTPEIQVLREELAKEEAIDVGHYAPDADVIPMPRRLDAAKASPSPAPPEADEDTDIPVEDAADEPAKFVIGSVKLVDKGKDKHVEVKLDGDDRTYRASADMLQPLMSAKAANKPVELVLNEMLIEEMILP